MQPDGVAEDSEPWATSVFELGQKVRDWTGNDASMLQANATEVADMVARRAPIVESLTQDAIELAGIPIRELLGPGWSA